MSVPQIEFAYPVDWPAWRAKTRGRREAQFRDNQRRLLWDTALRRLREQIALMNKNGRPYRVCEMTLSTNFELRIDGRPRRDRGAPSDPSVAFFFELDGEAHVLACDRWDSVPDNIAAIAAHINALRGQERWGVADMRQAFAGHVALPAPEQWWQVLNVSRNANASEIKSAFRYLARTAHADAGGSDGAMTRLSLARDAGLKAAAS